MQITQGFRLLGLDAPELKATEGKKLQRELAEKLEGRSVILDVRGKEKYGRYLAIIWIKGENVNDWLLKTGRAKAYSGGKR